MAVERTSEERARQASSSRSDAVLRTYGILAGVVPGRSLSDGVTTRSGACANAA
jgi:hypothetical protein